jgi:hypothetical protein
MHRRLKLFYGFLGEVFRGVRQPPVPIVVIDITQFALNLSTSFQKRISVFVIAKKQRFR